VKLAVPWTASVAGFKGTKLSWKNVSSSTEISVIYHINMFKLLWISGSTARTKRVRNEELFRMLRYAMMTEGTAVCLLCTLDRLTIPRKA
jgi:hypothetical protein